MTEQERNELVKRLESEYPLSDAAHIREMYEAEVRAAERPEEPEEPPF